MNLVDRAKKILLTPKTEWDAIAADATPTQQLIVGYVLPLAAVAAVAAFIGLVFIGTSVPFMGTVKYSMVSGLVGLIFSVVMAVVMVFVVGFIADALAPSFGGQKNFMQAFKVAAFAPTASWVAGIFGILPALSILAILGLYSLYLLYLGLPRLMKTPDEKAIPYLVVVIIAAIVLAVVIAGVAGLVIPSPVRGF